MILGNSMPASYVSYDQCRSVPSCVRPERLRVSLVTRVRVFTRVDAVVTFGVRVKRLQENGCSGRRLSFGGPGALGFTNGP